MDGEDKKIEQLELGLDKLDETSSENLEKLEMEEWPEKGMEMYRNFLKDLEIEKLDLKREKKQKKNKEILKQFRIELEEIPENEISWKEKFKILGRAADVIAEKLDLVDELAKIDYLTEFKNRRACIEEIFPAKFGETERKQIQGYILVMFDLDYFKKFNTELGEKEVDNKILRPFAIFLQKKVRLIDTIIRYGGDEFVGIFPISPGAEKMNPEKRQNIICERIRQSIEEEFRAIKVKTLLEEEKEVSLTISSGSFYFLKDDFDFKTLPEKLLKDQEFLKKLFEDQLQEANKRLVKAKEERNSFIITTKKEKKEYLEKKLGM